jgi:hypothetical protein
VDKFTIAAPPPASQQQTLAGNPSEGVYSRLSFDPSLSSYYRVTRCAATTTAQSSSKLSSFFSVFSPFQWLAIVSIAVLYNIIFVVGRKSSAIIHAAP